MKDDDPMIDNGPERGQPWLPDDLTIQRTEAWTRSGRGPRRRWIAAVPGTWPRAGQIENGGS